MLREEDGGMRNAPVPGWCRVGDAEDDGDDAGGCRSGGAESQGECVS